MFFLLQIQTHIQKFITVRSELRQLSVFTLEYQTYFHDNGSSFGNSKVNKTCFIYAFIRI